VRRPAVRAALLYAVVGGAWILLSDRLVDLLFHDVALRSWAQSIKGWLFVAVTAVLAYGLVRREVRARRALERAATRLQALHELDAAILSSRSLEGLVGAALERFRAIVPCVGVSLLRKVGDAEELVGAEPAERFPPGGTPVRAWDAIRGHGGDDVLFVRGLEGLPASLREGAVRSGARSMAVASMKLDGEAVGALVAFFEDARDPDEEMLAVMREVATQLGVALVQAELRRELERRAEELERRVRERTAELRSLNEELEAFAIAASHDLRAPLRAIVGFARALEEDHGQALGEGGREHLGRILRAAERMDALITDVLAYSRMARAELTVEPVPLEQTVEEALDTLDAEIRRTGAHVEVARPLPRVMAHAATLARVLTNLLNNALTFAEPGTTPRVRIAATQANGWVRLSVSDEGIGIAPEHLERIFRPFERLHGTETYPGTGFGLAIVRRAVERMGGRCGVESEPGRGSTFWLELPAPGAEATRVGPDAAT
jgi:signal transduction histidine kinase